MKRILIIFITCMFLVSGCGESNDSGEGGFFSGLLGQGDDASGEDSSALDLSSFNEEVYSGTYILRKGELQDYTALDLSNYDDPEIQVPVKLVRNTKKKEGYIEFDLATSVEQVLAFLEPNMINIYYDTIKARGFTDEQITDTAVSEGYTDPNQYLTDIAEDYLNELKGSYEKIDKGVRYDFTYEMDKKQMVMFIDPLAQYATVYDDYMEVEWQKMKLPGAGDRYFWTFILYKGDGGAKVSVSPATDTGVSSAPIAINTPTPAPSGDTGNATEDMSDVVCGYYGYTDCDWDDMAGKMFYNWYSSARVEFVTGLDFPDGAYEICISSSWVGSQEWIADFQGILEPTGQKNYYKATSFYDADTIYVSFSSGKMTVEASGPNSEYFEGEYIME